VESYVTGVGTRRSSGTSGEEFSDDVCRLLLPNGHYQLVDVLQPPQPYQTCVVSSRSTFSGLFIVFDTCSRSLQIGVCKILNSFQ